ncbi:MAG TPA: hypothetical protein VM709_12290 [Candidatus Sulfotelmatobacter sp.]|jgi:hypothetical protein|nr:hypothetical protein [Candidatus Sulfotelmatobacter sp.]
MAKGRLQQTARFADNFEEEKMEELLGTTTPRDIAALVLPEA